MHEVEEIADRAVVLRDGKNAGVLERSEITHERMVRMMVGRDLKEFFRSAAPDNGSKTTDGQGFVVTRVAHAALSKPYDHFQRRPRRGVGICGSRRSGTIGSSHARSSVLKKRFETEVSLDAHQRTAKRHQ